MLAAGVVPASLCASVLPHVGDSAAASGPRHALVSAVRRMTLPCLARHRVNDAAGLDLPRLVPVERARITSGFGRRSDPFRHGAAFHQGVDFAGRVGTPIHAVGNGVVVDASFHRDYGNVVLIDHGHGCVTLYAHASRLEVRRGDVVQAGQEIARMGSTGCSTGPHLHFEVRRDGERIDPEGELAARVLRGGKAGLSS